MSTFSHSPARSDNAKKHQKSDETNAGENSTTIHTASGDPTSSLQRKHTDIKPKDGVDEVTPAIPEVGEANEYGYWTLEANPWSSYGASTWAFRRWGDKSPQCQPFGPDPLGPRRTPPRDYSGIRFGIFALAGCSAYASMAIGGFKPKDDLEYEQLCKSFVR
jgi:hypothetical protein